MKTKEIRELTLPEIDKKLRDTKKELLNLRLRKQTGQVEKTHVLRDLRRDIARLATVRSQKTSPATTA